MDHRTFVDTMLSMHDKNYVPSTCTGADVKQLMHRNDAVNHSPVPAAAQQQPADKSRGSSPVMKQRGVLDDAGEGLGRLTRWFVTRVLPLSLLERSGKVLGARGWKINLPIAGIGAIVAIGLVGPSAALVATAFGALAGWFALRLLGGTLVLAAALTGLALALAVTAVVVSILYGAIAAAAGWPPFERTASPAETSSSVTDNARALRSYG
jgi:hypothetical protein